MDTVVNDLQFIGSDLTFINKLVHFFGGSDTVFQFSQLFSNSVAAKLSTF